MQHWVIVSRDAGEGKDGGDFALPPQFLADQLTLFQPGWVGQIMPTTLLPPLPEFWISPIAFFKVGNFH